MSSDYDHLCLMQKVEVFEHALGSTNGQDLAKVTKKKKKKSLITIYHTLSLFVLTFFRCLPPQVLWLKSRNSEVWLDRRTNYTRSLAVMSMVGYILGTLKLALSGISWVVGCRSWRSSSVESDALAPHRQNPAHRLWRLFRGAPHAWRSARD